MLYSPNDTETTDTALYIADSTKYWFVRADSQARFYDDFQINNFIATGGNDVSLEDLLLIEKRFRVTSQILENRYKEIYKKASTDKVISEFKTKNKDDNVPQDILDSTTRSASTAAKNAFFFIEEMEVGDIVLVPSQNSKDFLIGVILSDVFDTPIDHVRIYGTNGEEENYNKSTFDKKRRVLWIKEITQRDLPDQLNWIRYAHQAIFDITDNSELINLLISPKVVYKKQFYSRIGVETTDPVFDDDLFQFQKVVQNVKRPGLQIVQKTKVQSPGDIIQIVNQADWKSLLYIAALLFGEVKTDHLTIKGVFPFFYSIWNEEAKYKRKENIAKSKAAIAKAESEENDITSLSSQNVERSQLETENQRLNNDLISQEVRTKQLENIQREKNLKGDARFNELFRTDTLSDDTQLPEVKLTEDEQDMVDNLKLTDSTVGTVVTDETQMDKLIETEDESEK